MNYNKFGETKHYKTQIAPRKYLISLNKSSKTCEMDLKTRITTSSTAELINKKKTIMYYI